MAKKKSSKKATKVRSLPARKGKASGVKGGSTMLSSAFSNVMKGIGDGLSSMARKG
jgi:hypothetical protein